MGQDKAAFALSVREIFELIQTDLEAVEREISLESVASNDAITAIGRYLQSSGGKRLRPSLLLLSSNLFRKTNETVIKLGAVVEMLHTATLVHDDVIDGADTRRGRPSTNAQWGNHICVLAGDWMYMQAFQMALRERNFRILDLLIALTQSMVEGELFQLERLGQIDVSEADYMDLVDRKTANLFSVCTRLGAIAGGADSAAEEKLGEYGWNLGMAFQIVDDLLDFTAEESVLGKPVGGDLREGKVTLPLIYALEQAGAGERAQIAQILKDRNYSSGSFAKVREMIDSYGGFDRAQERALNFIDRARAVLADFPESPFQRALMAITHLVTERDH